jgi:hypothetical protein
MRWHELYSLTCCRVRVGSSVAVAATCTGARVRHRRPATQGPAEVAAGLSTQHVHVHWQRRCAHPCGLWSLLPLRFICALVIPMVGPDVPFLLCFIVFSVVFGLEFSLDNEQHKYLSVIHLS